MREKGGSARRRVSVHQLKINIYAINNWNITMLSLDDQFLSKAWR